MKKCILTGIMLMGLMTVNAQMKKTGTSFGVKSGVNVSYFVGEEDLHNDVLISPTAGVYLNIGLSDNFSIQPEVNFTRVGNKYVTDRVMETVDADGTPKVTHKQIMDYISVPVMLKYYPAKGFNIAAGPEAAYNIYAVHTSREQFSEHTTKHDKKDDVKDFDFGVNFGLGYELSENLNINARYRLALDTFNDTDKGGEPKNNVFTLGVGYSF